MTSLKNDNENNKLLFIKRHYNIIGDGYILSNLNKLVLYQSSFISNLSGNKTWEFKNRYV